MRHAKKAKLDTQSPGETRTGPYLTRSKRKASELRQVIINSDDSEDGRASADHGPKSRRTADDDQKNIQRESDDRPSPILLKRKLRTTRQVDVDSGDDEDGEASADPVPETAEDYEDEYEMLEDIDDPTYLPIPDEDDEEAVKFWEMHNDPFWTQGESEDELAEQPIAEEQTSNDQVQGDFYTDEEIPKNVFEPVSSENDKQDIKRFQQRILKLISSIKEYTRKSTGEEFRSRISASTPISPIAFFILVASYPEILANRVFNTMPEKTQALLGRLGLQLVDLLELPRVSRNSSTWGTYIDIPMYEVEALQDTRSIAVAGRHYCAGVYIGSSARKVGGIAARIRQHAFEGIKRTAPIPVSRTAHYSIVRDNHARMQFRQLSGAPYALDDGARALSSITEGLLMVYFNTIRPPKKSWALHNDVVMAFIESLRSEIPDLPDFSPHALNEAWSLKQGWGGKLVPNVCTVCKSTGKIHLARLGDVLGPRVCQTHLLSERAKDPAWLLRGACITCERSRSDPGQFYGEGPTSLCISCYVRKQTTLNKNSPEWRALGDCTMCHRPRTRDGSKFLGSGATSLCYNCLSKRWRIHRKNSPDWQARGPCVDCDKPRTPDGLWFYGSGSTSRCTSCSVSKWHTQTRKSSDWYAQGACVDCNKTRKPDGPGFVGSGTTSRCWSCADKQQKIKKKKSPDWQARGPCADCGKPRTPDGPWFLGSGSTSRCLQCNQIRRIPTTPRNSPEWRALGNCVDCHRPRTSNGPQFVGSGATSRCRPCRDIRRRSFTGDCEICSKPRGNPRAWGKQEDGLCGACENRNGTKRLSDPERALERMKYQGCGNCGVVEWTKGLSPFRGLGLARRCDACFRHKAFYKVERPQSLW